MLSKARFPLALGIAGCGILIALGIWQVQRLHWKQSVIATIAARIEAPPQALPANPAEATDEYVRVEVFGTLHPDPLHVLTFKEFSGPGFRVIQALQLTDGRKVMVDLGFIPEADKNQPAAIGELRLVGSLLWPDETDAFTPKPNLGENIWFARDLEPMAQALGTQPILIVASNTDRELAPLPLPVTIAIANNHLQYAITWFALALVWALMTVYALWRIRRRID